MKNQLRRVIRILLSTMMVLSSADVTAFAADAEVEDSLSEDIIDGIDQSEVNPLYDDEIPDEEIAALGSSPYSIMEVTYNGGGSIPPFDQDTIVKNDIDLRTADYIKVVTTVIPQDDDFYYWASAYLYLVDSSTGKKIKPVIKHEIEGDSSKTFVDYFRRDSGENWNYSKVSIGLRLWGNFKYVQAYKLQSYSIGYASYNFVINENYNHMGEYRERIFTREDEYENGKLVDYPKPYFTDGNGNHVKEKQFFCGQDVSASVWEGGGTNSQGVRADGGTVNYCGLKLAKPGKDNELSGFITTGASFTFDQNFLGKYQDYMSSNGTFTLVPIYEPKYQAVQFINDYAAVDGKADVKGVYEGFSSGYTQSATKLDTIRVSAKAASGYAVSHLILQSPVGAYYDKANRSDKWTEWRTRKSSQGSENPSTLAAAINYKGDMWNSAMTSAILGKNLCRVLIFYGNAPTGTLTMAPSPQSVTEGADGKLTFIQGPGAENDPNLGKTVDAGGTIEIDNVQLFKPYIFGAKPKSNFHAYWKDGTLDTDGDGSDDTRIPGYEPFRNTFGDQFKFIPQVPAKNKVYYNFVKDVNVAKEVKPLPIKGYLYLNDRLLISDKKVQKGIPGITAFASGFKAGQEVTTDSKGYYELESNDRFKYYDLYDYNVTFTGESEAGTIGVIYSQNPNKLGNVIVDATDDVDITDVKLLTEQNKKGGNGKEYVTVDTSDAKLSADGYFAMPGGDRNYRLRMSAHRGTEILTKGVLTFTNTNGKKVSIEAAEDASHSGLFTFDFNPKAKGIDKGATARVAFTGNGEYLSRDVGLKVADCVGTLKIRTTLASTKLGGLGTLGASEAADEENSFAKEAISFEWSGDFDDITDNLASVYMDDSDRVICAGFGRKIYSAGGEKDLLMDLARTAAKARVEGCEAALRAQEELDEKIEAIQSEYRQQAEFDEGLPMDLGFSFLMTFGYDDENGQWYFKDMMLVTSADADSDTTENIDTGLGLTTGVDKHLRATGRATFVVEERQDLTQEERKKNRYYITEDNKDSFDILSVAGEGEDRRLDSYGRLDLNPEITFTGTAGLAKDLVQVDVDGKTDYNLVYGTSAEGLGEYAQNASLKLRVMNYNDTIPLLNGVYNDSLSLSADTLETEDLSYLEGEDSWYGGGDVSGVAAEDENGEFAAIDEGGFAAYQESALANRIAADAGYEMVPLGDGRFAAVYLNVAQDRIRDKENSKAAFYTYYDGTLWSEPVVLSDDSTLDLYPHIYSLKDGGAIALWSSVSEGYKDSDDKIERQNALDLYGRIVNADGTLGDSIPEITESTDPTADRVIGVTQNGDKLVIVYEKRSYEISGKEATVGDMLYPKSCYVAYRSYDLSSGELEKEYLYDGYLPGGGMLLDSDMATFTAGGKATGILAYTADTDGNLNTSFDRELYLSTYDFDTNSFAEPAILTGYNVNPDATRPENSSPKFVSTEDALYLLWLQGGDIVSMNAGKLLLPEGKTAEYDGPATLVYGSAASDADGYQIGAITAFGAETDGKDIYVIWPQGADRPKNSDNGLKDIQMWGVRAEAKDGIMSTATRPVQITSHYGNRYDDVAFGVYDGVVYGLASNIPSRMITQSEAREVFADSFDETTFVPYAIWDHTGACPVAFKISGVGASRIKNAGFISARAGESALFSLEIHNYSFSDLNGAKAAATDKYGNSCTLYQTIDGETIESPEAVVNDLRGGDAYIITGAVPLSEDAKNAEVTITLTLADGTVEDYVTINKELSSDISLQDISISDTAARGFYMVKGSIVNEGSARSEAGAVSLVVLRSSQEKVLKQLEYPALMPGETYEWDMLIEASDDDFTPSDESAEQLYLYADYNGGRSEYRISVQDADKNFITRKIQADRLEDLGYVTGVQIDAVKAAEDEEGYLTGLLVSSGKSVITLEAGEIVDIQAEILTNSPRKGAQASVDAEGKIVQTSTGTEGLVWHYEYIGDNAEINTDGMLSALEKGSGRLRVYVYPDTSEFVADNNAGDTTVEINGEQFQSMDDEDSYGEDAFHKLPAGAIRTFVIDVNIIGAGERGGMADPLSEKGIRYRRLNDTSVAVCGLEQGKTISNLTIPATVTIDGKKYNVTLIDAYAFNQDSDIKAVTIGKNVTSIGSGAFEGCENISKLTLGSGLTQIGESAFKGCANIAAITLPSKLERIEAEGFYGCSSIKSLVIPASVAYIGDRAFYGCEGLKKITIRSEKLSGDNFGRDVFFGAPKNAEYKFEIKDEAVKSELTDKLTEALEQLTDKKGIVYRITSKADRTLSVVGLSEAAESKLKTVSILSRVTYKGAKYTVTAIGDGAFTGNTKLTKVTIPKTVTSIGNGAFAGMTALKSVAIPAPVTNLGAEAFSGCVKLSKVTIASPNLTVGEDAFMGVPDTATFKYAFKGDEAVRNLRAQILSESSTFVSRSGLQYEILDPKLTVVILTGTTDKSIKTLIVPDTVLYRGVKLSVISVQDGAFAYHKNLTKVTLGKKITEICPDAFAGCKSLSSVNLKGVQKIYFSAFTDCTSLKKITLPKTVQMIGNEAFVGCTALETIIIQSETPTKLEFVGADAFENISAKAAFKISAKKAEDKQTITRLLTESGVDPTRIK